MSLDLSTQSSLLTSLSASLTSYLGNTQNSSALFNTQVSLIDGLNKTLEKNITKINDLNQSLQGMKSQLEKIESINYNDSSKLDSAVKETFKAAEKEKITAASVTQTLDKGAETLNTTEQEMQQSVKKAQENQKTLKSTSTTASDTKSSARQIDKATENTKRVSVIMKENCNTLKDMVKELKSKASELLDGLTGFLPPPWGTAVSVTVSVLANLFQFGWRFISTSVSVYVSLLKTVYTMPFMIADSFIETGNALRTEIIERIGNTIESFKESFDMESYVGRGLYNLKSLATDSLLTLQDNTERLTRIFGFENVDGLLNTAIENVKSIGNFSEFVGKSMTSNLDSVDYITSTQRLLGIGAEDLTYYALESFTNLKGINEVLEENITAIKTASSKHNVEFKFVSNAFHRLRKDIVQFGHLSAMELAEVSSQIVKMKLSADDLVGIFGKISSFESAVDMSVQLQQAFGATIDAYDLLTADDPIQMIKMLREGMLNSGKQFKTLNRHEKSLLKSITGLSDSVLQTTFSYKGLSMTQEEIQEEMEKTDPTEVMIQSLKGMTSAIRSIVKIMNFQNPFEALWSGLMEAAAYNKEMTGGAINISEAYEKLELVMKSLPAATIDRVTMPLVIILGRFSDLIQNGTIQRIFTGGVRAVAEFFNDVFATATDNTLDDLLLDFTRTLDLLRRTGHERLQNISQAQGDNLVKMFKSFSTDNEEMKKILEKRGLLDEEGNIKQGITLESVRNVLISTINLGNDSLKAAIQSSFEESVKLSLQTIDDQLKNMRGVSENIQNEILGSRGVNRIIDKAFENISEVIGESEDVISQFAKLGRNIAGSLVKGFLVTSTIFLNLLNNKTDDAYEIYKKHVDRDLELPEGQTKQNFFLSLLGFKDGELDSLTDGILEESNKLGDKASDKLIPALEMVYNQIAGMYRFLYDGITSLLYSVMRAAAAADDNVETVLKAVGLGNAIKKGALADVFGSLSSNSVSNIKQGQIDSALEVLSDSEFFKNYGDNLVQQQQISLANYHRQQVAQGDTFLGRATGNLDLLFLKQLVYIKNNSQKIKEIFELNVNKDSPNVVEKRIENLNNVVTITKAIINELKNPELETQKIDDLMAKVIGNTPFGSLKEVEGSLLAILKSDINAVKSTNDIIKLHDNDEVEVIASKQGGLIRKVYQQLSDQYKLKVMQLKEIKNRKKAIEREEVYYDDNESVVLDLLGNINNYIDITSNSKNVSIKQKSIRFVES